MVQQVPIADLGLMHKLQWYLNLQGKDPRRCVSLVQRYGPLDLKHRPLAFEAYGMAGIQGSG